MRLNPLRGPTRLRRGIVGAVTLTLATGLVAVVASQASAATGCRVAYSVNQWPGGFTGNIVITNLGDPINGWQLKWSFANGQTVSQGWGATFTQSGSQVTATNMSWNAGLPTNGTANPGFNGTWTGTNSIPTAFTLNGVACTGSASGTTAATTTRATTATTRATTATTRATTPATTTAATTASRAPGVPSNAVWSSSDQWATWTSGDYILYNNMWGANGTGSQTIWAVSTSNWGVISNFPETSGVKTYPNVTRDINQSISSLSRVSSSFNVSVPGSGSWETAYDIWVDNYAYEIMIWMNKNGAVGPIAASYDSNGAVPSASNQSIGGRTWNVYRGSNGSNQVYSFIGSNTNSATVDVLAILNWLRTNSWLSSGAVLGRFQFGFEITSAPGGLAFTCNSFSLSL